MIYDSTTSRYKDLKRLAKCRFTFRGNELALQIAKFGDPGNNGPYTYIVDAGPDIQAALNTKFKAGNGGSIPAYEIREKIRAKKGRSTEERSNPEQIRSVYHLFGTIQGTTLAAHCPISGEINLAMPQWDHGKEKIWMPYSPWGGVTATANFSQNRVLQKVPSINTSMNHSTMALEATIYGALWHYRELKRLMLNTLEWGWKANTVKKKIEWHVKPAPSTKVDDYDWLGVVKGMKELLQNLNADSTVKSAEARGPLWSICLESKGAASAAAGKTLSLNAKGKNYKVRIEPYHQGGPTKMVHGETRGPKRRVVFERPPGCIKFELPFGKEFSDYVVRFWPEPVDGPCHFCKGMD
ncbi:uncharacterized protein CDV56_103859 [Aspergillus thermomutatus]|uniref:Uncharacterized protein n=1 Tax=Aspergillus thermomutatus TaxID=41047 RepID=A0A397GEW9_ASPTH|nr:uncharacterized protein CDV56_103859 [Aspergillus thermomutatus]RHZ48374.1 hypothetical protein CDV56_103859 [Aspergillus thermomutatus]